MKVITKQFCEVSGQHCEILDQAPTTQYGYEHTYIIMYDGRPRVLAVADVNTVPWPITWLVPDNPHQYSNYNQGQQMLLDEQARLRKQLAQVESALAALNRQ